MGNMDCCPSLASGLGGGGSTARASGPIEAMRVPSVKVIVEKPTQAKTLRRSLHWYGMGRTDWGEGWWLAVSVVGETREALRRRVGSQVHGVETRCRAQHEATPRVTDRGSRAQRRIGWPETGVSRPKLERCSQRTESNSSSPLPTQRFLECWVLGTVASRRRRPNPTSSPWAREEAWGDPATPATLQRATLLPMFARRDLAGRLAMPLWVPRWGQAARAAGRRSGRTAW